RLLAPGDVELLAARRARPDEDRVEALVVEERLHAVHGRRVADVDAHVGDHRDLLVEHALRQPERGDVRAHEAARLGELLEDRDAVAERHEVVGDGQRRRPGADAGDAAAVPLAGRARQPPRDVAAQVRGDTLQATDRHGLAVDARAPAGRLTRAVAGPAQD